MAFPRSEQFILDECVRPACDCFEEDSPSCTEEVALKVTHIGDGPVCAIGAACIWRKYVSVWIVLFTITVDATAPVISEDSLGKSSGGEYSRQRIAVTPAKRCGENPRKGPDVCVVCWLPNDQRDQDPYLIIAVEIKPSGYISVPPVFIHFAI